MPRVNLARTVTEGSVLIDRATAPPAGDIPTSASEEWWDPTVGNPKRRVEGKDSAGTLLSRTYLFAETAGSLSGALVDRPAAAAANAGQFYFATNVHGGALYRSTGAAWVLVGPSVAESVTAETVFDGTAQAASTEVVIATAGTIRANSLEGGSTEQFSFYAAVTLINSATARTLKFRVRYGGLAGTLLLDSTNLTVPASTAKTDVATVIQGGVVVRTIGATGTCWPYAQMMNEFASAAGARILPLGQLAVTIDTTADKTFVLTVQESVNSVADLVKGEAGSIQLLK